MSHQSRFKNPRLIMTAKSNNLLQDCYVTILSDQNHQRMDSYVTIYHHSEYLFLTSDNCYVTTAHSNRLSSLGCYVTISLASAKPHSVLVIPYVVTHHRNVLVSTGCYVTTMHSSCFGYRIGSVPTNIQLRDLPVKHQYKSSPPGRPNRRLKESQTKPPRTPRGFLLGTKKIHFARLSHIGPDGRSTFGECK